MTNGTDTELETAASRFGGRDDDDAGPSLAGAPGGMGDRRTPFSWREVIYVALAVGAFTSASAIIAARLSALEVAVGAMTTAIAKVSDAQHAHERDRDGHPVLAERVDALRDRVGRIEAAPRP